MSQKDREAQRLLDEEIRKELLQRKLREESKLRVNEFERKKVRLKEKQLDEERKKLEVDFEIKRLQQEAEEKRQMELASKKRETYAKLLEYSWDYQFQKLWTQSLQEPTSFENSLTYGIRFYKHLGVFVAKSTEVFRLLVNELAFPLHSRQLHPYQVLERPNILRYRYQNLQIQVVKRSECEQWKTFGHELRANESVLESVYTSSKSGNSCNLRVELSCIVDYKGFRGLVTAKAPLEGERTLVHGPKSDGVYIGHPAVYSGLSGIAKDLRLREHNFEWNETVGPAYVHLSAFSELHKSLGYRDLESYILETLGKNEEESLAIEDNVYIVRLGSIFPVDFREGGRENVDFSKRLRPEYLKMQKIRLSADAFINIHPESRKLDKQVVEASKKLRSSQILVLVRDLDSLRVNPIDSESVTGCLHSYGINMRYLGLVATQTSLPHIRQIAVIEILARACKEIYYEKIADYILEIGSLESGNMSGIDKNTRTGSVMINSFESRSTSMFSRTKEKKISASVSMDIERNAGIFYDLLPINTIYIDGKLAEFTAEFVNLVFGKGKDASVFWTDSLIPAAVKFNISREYLQKNSVNLNALLHAVSFHCSILIRFTAETPLGKVSNPFAPADISVITHKAKMYKMNSLEYRILAERSEYFRKCKNYPLALQSCELKLRINKATKSQNKLGDPAVLTEIGEILLETNDLDFAMKKAKEALVQIHPLHASTIRNWCILTKALFMKNIPGDARACFESALTVLNFHWGSLHPLYSKLCIFLADIFMHQDNLLEALSLYKSALSSCFQVLGPNNIHTSQVYIELSKYYCIIGSYSDALVSSEKVYLNYTAFYGSGSIHTVSYGVSFAEVLFKLGRYEQAQGLVARACEMFTEILKQDDGVEATRKAKAKEEMKEVLKRFYKAAIIGMKIGLKASKSVEILRYSDNLWMAERYLEGVKSGIIVKAMKFALDARINMIGNEKKSIIMKNVYLNSAGENEIRLLHDNFMSERFKTMVHQMGGLSLYLDRLISQAIEITKQSKVDKGQQIYNNQVILELKAILRISVDDEKSKATIE